MLDNICIIALSNIIFYLKTLGYKYSSDDIPAFRQPKNKSKIIHWLWVLEGRARHSPQADHALTMFIHTLVCIFIYIGFGANGVSFLAALLFSFNPANNQAAVWIAGRGYALSALGMVMILSFPVFAPILLLGVAYYNAGFVAPICLLGINPIYICFLPLAWLFHVKRFKRNVVDKVKGEMLAEDRKVKPQKLILFIKTFGFYTSLALVPFKNTFYHSFMQSLAGSGKDKAYSIKCRFFWLGVIYVLGIGWFWLSRPWDMVSFGLLWWVICISPFCNMFRLNQEIAERYMYLPNVGLMFVLANVLVSYPVWAGVVVAIYTTKMWFYMDAFQDDYYLIESACLNSPDSWFAWHSRALQRWERQSFMEAVILWTMAQMISPKEFKVLVNLSTALWLAGHREEAKAFLKRAEENIPEGQEESANKIISEWRKGQLAVLL